MLRYLKQKEKKETRELYSECFGEDSESFKDYYFDNKIKDNLILVDEDAVGRIRSMANLNPYKTKIKNRIYTTNYIVAVATDDEFRRQGLMRKIIKKMLNDMREERKPFTWLMPADELYYKPFDFRYIFNQPLYAIRDDAKLKEIPYTEAYAVETVDMINSWLEAHSELYCVRDGVYLNNLKQEVESEAGHLNLLYSEAGKLVGIKAMWGIEKQQLRTLICEDAYVLQTATKPAIMARIVDVEEFMKSICLKEDNKSEEEAFKIKITDKYIEDNEGLYIWHIDKDSSYLEKLDELKTNSKDIENIPEFDIAHLTSWLFGYSDSHKATWCNQIRTIRGIFLDEVI